MAGIDIATVQDDMDIEIDVGKRLHRWDVGIGDDEPCFLGVEDYELDELKGELGHLVVRGAKGAKHQTVHERSVKVRADTLRQLIMTCEKYAALRQSQKKR